MLHPVLLAQLGLSTESARILSWLVEVGACVQEGQVLAEVETDKSTIEVAAPASGYLRQILVSVDEVGQMGSPIALITTTADELMTQPAPSVPPTPVEAASPLPQQPDYGGRAFPASRRRARELGVDLSAVTGSGPNGVITLDDVEAAARRRIEPAIAASPTASSMREAVTRTVTKSWSIPQFWVERSVELTAAELQLQAFTAATGDTTPRLFDMLFLACARVLQRYPQLAGVRDADGVGQPAGDGISIGYLVAAAGGLLVPVIHRADQQSLGDLCRSRRAVVERATSGRLTPAELTGAGFTISNLGPFGADRAMALVIPGQTAILAVGRIRSPHTPGEGTGAIGMPVISLVITCDHRAVDGAEAAAFLNDLAEMLQQGRLSV